MMIIAKAGALRFDTLAVTLLLQKGIHYTAVASASQIGLLLI